MASKSSCSPSDLNDTTKQYRNRFLFPLEDPVRETRPTTRGPGPEKTKNKLPPLAGARSVDALTAGPLYRHFDIISEFHPESPDFDMSPFAFRLRQYSRLHYSVSKLPQMDENGNYLYKEIWGQYSSLPLEETDMECLHKWAMSIMPRGAQDFKPLFILCQGLLRDCILQQLTINDTKLTSLASLIASLTEEKDNLANELERTVKLTAEMLKDVRQQGKDEQSAKLMHIIKMLRAVFRKEKDHWQSVLDGNIQAAAASWQTEVLQTAAAPLQAELGALQRESKQQAQTLNDLYTNPKELASMLQGLDRDQMVEALTAMDAGKLAEVLQNISPLALVDVLAAMDPTTLASVLSLMDSKMLTKLLTEMNPQALAGMFEKLSAKSLTDIFKKTNLEALARGLAGMSTSALAELLRHLPQDVLSQVLAAMPPSSLAELLGRMQPTHVGVALEALAQLHSTRMGEILSNMSAPSLADSLCAMPPGDLGEALSHAATDVHAAELSKVPVPKQAAVLEAMDDAVLADVLGRLNPSIFGAVLGKMSSTKFAAILNAVPQEMLAQTLSQAEVASMRECWPSSDEFSVSMGGSLSTSASAAPVKAAAPTGAGTSTPRDQNLENKTSRTPRSKPATPGAAAPAASSSAAQTVTLASLQQLGPGELLALLQGLPRDELAACLQGLPAGAAQTLLQNNPTGAPQGSLPGPAAGSERGGVKAASGSTMQALQAPAGGGNEDGGRTQMRPSDLAGEAGGNVSTSDHHDQRSAREEGCGSTKIRAELATVVAKLEDSKIVEGFTAEMMAELDTLSKALDPPASPPFNAPPTSSWHTPPALSGMLPLTLLICLLHDTFHIPPPLLMLDDKEAILAHLAEMEENIRPQVGHLKQMCEAQGEVTRGAVESAQGIQRHVAAHQKMARAMVRRLSLLPAAPTGDAPLRPSMIVPRGWKSDFLQQLFAEENLVLIKTIGDVAKISMRAFTYLNHTYGIFSTLMDLQYDPTLEDEQEIRSVHPENDFKSFDDCVFDVLASLHHVSVTEGTAFLARNLDSVEYKACNQWLAASKQQAPDAAGAASAVEVVFEGETNTMACGYISVEPVAHGVTIPIILSDSCPMKFHGDCYGAVTFLGMLEDLEKGHAELQLVAPGIALAVEHAKRHIDSSQSDIHSALSRLTTNKGRTSRIDMQQTLEMLQEKKSEIERLMSSKQIRNKMFELSRYPSAPRQVVLVATLVTYILGSDNINDFVEEKRAIPHDRNPLKNLWEQARVEMRVKKKNGMKEKNMDDDLIHRMMSFAPSGDDKGEHKVELMNSILETVKREDVIASSKSAGFMYDWLVVVRRLQGTLQALETTDP
ncbi:hypothetical protein CYMTET_29831 [Cymbomonas tetramitiformis]|uniref:Magnesium transporter MgtE intracellular domain-containing protein n=1 Tax=Cymbomonas tetramitiformis TaxID=36881 RepID=A0AAE0KUS8_9CHLO|nr:hypothetical protein CYMTET_29831 [Cymbomonas tetramitiformis]